MRLGDRTGDQKNKRSGQLRPEGQETKRLNERPGGYIGRKGLRETMQGAM